MSYNAAHTQPLKLIASILVLFPCRAVQINTISKGCAVDFFHNRMTLGPHVFVYFYIQLKTEIHRVNINCDGCLDNKWFEWTKIDTNDAMSMHKQKQNLIDNQLNHQQRKAQYWSWLHFKSCSGIWAFGKFEENQKISIFDKIT